MDNMKQMGNMPHNETHGMLDDLIAGAKPTHKAIKSGAWSDAATWAGGKIPGAGATVLIEDGTTVTYDQISEERIKTIVVEGNLKFATNADTELYVETIINSEDGKLDIGSQQNAVAAGKQARIVFTSDRAVDTKWDPTQLSKGLVSHGEVNIYGAEKAEKAVLAGDVSAGNNVLTFKGGLEGWAVGDQIAVGGTSRQYNGSDADNSKWQDEVLTITKIDGNNVRFTNDDIKTGDNTVLRYNHTVNTYADAGELNLYAANLTRNVSFETENGKDVPINQRAHVMLMHNPSVNVSNAGFYDLGRSDKTQMVDDVGENVDGSPGSGKNPRGRYALHLHKMGVGNGLANISGNVVSGSPGWGIVQHESSADLTENVVFDTVGSGIVAESGNETGAWTDNLVMKTTGIDWKVASNQREAREKKFDFASEGIAYWIQGAGLIKNKNNKAISFNSRGMELFSGSLNITDDYRPVETIDVSTLPADIQKLLPKDQTEIDIRDVPMADVTGFEAYNGTSGLRVWGHKTNFDGEGEFSGKNEKDALRTAHLGRSLVKDFKLWNNLYSGLDVSYSSNIDVQDGLILAKDDQYSGGGAGLFSNHVAFNSAYDNLTIKGFEQGAKFEYLNNDKDFVAPTLKNSTFSDNKYNLTKVGDEEDREGRPDDYASFIKLENNQFAEAEGNAAPTARFASKAIGGLAVKLDASASSDADPLLPKDGKPRALESNGIAAYGWDLNNDGKIDQFGRTINPVFDKAGNRTVGLTVIDSQGKATTATQTVNVQPTAYSNAFDNGSFDAAETLEPWQGSSQWSDEGWYITDSAQISGGVADLSKPGTWSNHIGQVVRDENIHRGEQTLSFKLKNIEGGNPDQPWKNNEISVELWGVDGQFYNNPWEGEGSSQIGALPMQRTQLVSENFGGETGEFFDWKNFSYDVDLGDGYDYLMFQVKGTHLLEDGDDVALDNVSLTGKANSVPGSLNPPNTINPSPKFAPRPSVPLKSTAPSPAPLEPVDPMGPMEPMKPVEPADPMDIDPMDPTTDGMGPTAPIADKPDAEPPIAAPPETETSETETPETETPVVEQPTTLSDADQNDLSSLVAELSFEEGKGRLARDTSTTGKNNRARLRQGMSWTEGKVGSAIALNGEQDVVTVKSSPDINRGTRNQHTVSMWFKVEDIGADRQQVIFEQGSKGRGLNAYLEDDQLFVGGWDNPRSGWAGSWVASDKVDSGQWHHVAVVLDGQNGLADDALTAYLDGKEFGQTQGAKLMQHGRLSLGNTSGSTRFEDGFGTSGSNGLSGAIDEVKIFNSALSDSQVQALATV